MTLVPPCHWLETHIKGSFMREYPVRVIYNGVNRDTFHPVDGLYLRNKYRIASPYIALAVAADWDERKGLPYLIQAAQALGPEYQVVAVGLESPQIAELPQGILGIERTESVTELAAWYSLSDCLVNPTLEDNMPLVNLEALACGTPVACFATGGCVEAVDSSCGRVVPKGDALALAEAVRELSAQKPQITEACIARAAQVFDSESCYQQYLDLYKEVCR